MRRILLLLLCFAVSICEAQKNKRQTLQTRTAYAAPGVSQIIILDTNNTFKMAAATDEKPAVVFGSWSASFNKLTLFGQDSSVSQFKINGDQLVELDAKGRPVSKNKNNNLVRKNLVSSKVYKDLLNELDFVAFGSETAWSLDINHKTFVQLTLPGISEPIKIDTKTPVIVDDSIIYEAGEVKAVFYPGYCDGFGADVYDYKAKLYYKDQVYTGCAAVMHRPTLEGDWDLITAVGADSGWKKEPFIQIDLKNQVFSGNAGCNIMRGIVRLQDDKVIFSDIFTTKMDCVNYDEQKLIDVLVKCNRYEIEKLTLKLYKDDELIMTFLRHQ